MATSKKNIEEMIARKVTEDPAFKRLLEENPHEAIQTACGIDIPKKVAIRCVYETRNKAYLILPPDSYHPGELAEAELESNDVLSGGSSTIATAFCCN